jgi:hypothetical protein
MHRESTSLVAGSRFLGWTSLGIGLAEFVLPKNVESLLGLEDRPSHRGILRVLGLRELMHGLSILTERRPSREMAASVWSRVAGDLLDNALLGVAATKTRNPGRFAAIAASVAGIGLMDIYYSWRLSKHRNQRQSRLLQPASSRDCS